MAGRNLKISTVSYFFIAFVLDGLQRQSGLFIWKILKSMNANRQTAAVPFCTSWAVANIIASFSDKLVLNRKSAYMILVGVLLTAAGSAFCLLASNVTILVVCWGLIFGTGYGLASPQLAKHLKNVNSCNAPLLLQTTPNVGTVIMPFITDVVISIYGLQGSYVIFSGIILNYLPLCIAAAYNIELRIPDIKWRMRKWSSQYSVSKQQHNKITSNESFINSLEPDLILEINQSDASEETNNDRENSEIDIERYKSSKSDTKGNDSQSLQVDFRVFPPNKTKSEILAEIRTYEKGKTVFEGSFNNKDFVCKNNDCIKLDRDSLHSNESQKCTALLSNKLDMNDLEESCINLKREVLQIHSKDHESKTNKENSGSKCKYLQNDKDGENNKIIQNIAYLRNETLSEFTKHDNNVVSLSKESLKKSGKTTNIKIPETIHEKTVVSKTNFKSMNSFGNGRKLSTELLKEQLTNIPIDIKVHVEECTFTTDEEYWLESIRTEYPVSRNNSYRKHSNSVLPGTYDNIDFTCFSKTHAFHKPKSSNIYSISENIELDDYPRVSSERNNPKQNTTNYTISNIKRVLKFINEITMPVCLCIILITIIFEFNLVTLIAMFADFANDIDKDFSDCKWILVSFGIGGLLGKLCCCTISKTIPEKSHGLGVVLFLLKGLSIAGVLFSSSMEWLAVFYCILGGLEGGITDTIPKLISEYIDKDIHAKLSASKMFLSGTVVICVPYAIGLSRDQLGDYEFLLQTLSCSCVLCALLVYFVPQLSRTTKPMPK